MKTPRIPKDTPELDLELQKQLIAYQLWEEDGRPEGRAEEHWDKACLVVMSLADGEVGPSPVWLKQHNSLEESAAETLPMVESLTKRNATRHAA